MGNNPVLNMARANHDPYDQFAWVQGWRFAICEVLLFDWGTLVPGFSTMASEPEDSYEVEELRTLYTLEGDSIPVSDWHVEGELLHALKVLDRYREWLQLAGKDY